MTDTPDDFVDAALAALHAAVEDRHAELRTLQLATVSPDGCPAVRSVVLRAFDRDARLLEVHADALSAKLRDLAADPRVCLIAWSAADRLQLRLDGAATLHVGDAVATRTWNDLGGTARTAYAFIRTPGQPIADPDEPPRTENEAAMFERFAVIRIAVSRIDVLRLDGDAGQRRAVRHCGAGAATAFVSP